MIQREDSVWKSNIPWLRANRIYSYFWLMDSATWHPLDTRRIRKMVQHLSWKIYNSLSKHDVVVPSINQVKLIVPAFMKGAYQVLSCSIHEFTWMSFAFHYLRSDDLFFDVGANIGSWAVPCVVQSGCSAVAFEPDPAVFSYLDFNVKINGVQDKITIRNEACSWKTGSVVFTTEYGVTNRVVDEDTKIPTRKITSIQIDESFSNYAISFFKIDVEGHAGEVIKGCRKTLRSSTLNVIILEIFSPNETVYDMNGVTIVNYLKEEGFCPVSYHPFDRSLEELKTIDPRGTTIFVRDFDMAQQRCKEASGYSYKDMLI